MLSLVIGTGRHDLTTEHDDKDGDEDDSSRTNGGEYGNEVICDYDDPCERARERARDDKR
jgi:hypothetical protein